MMISNQINWGLRVIILGAMVFSPGEQHVPRGTFHVARLWDSSLKLCDAKKNDAKTLGQFFPLEMMSWEPDNIRTLVLLAGLYTLRHNFRFAENDIPEKKLFWILRSTDRF